MNNPLIDYYKQYYDHNGYQMEQLAQGSRVAILCDWVKKYTPTGGRILDIGCGDMHLSTLLPEYDWTGIDINTAKAKGKAVEHDLGVSPYPVETSSIDTVICSEVLEHVWDPRVIYREAERVLKKKGTFILSTPNYHHIDHFLTHFKQLIFDPNMSHLYEHIRQYTLDTHLSFLAGIGFKEVEHCGADAQYTQLFAPARKVLRESGLTMTQADVLLAKMFPDFSHTIMIVAQRK